MIYKTLPISLFLLVAGTGISMSGQILNGKSSDARVVLCGLEIEGDPIHSVRPFIKTSEEITGSLELIIQATTGTNRNMTVQRTSLSALPIVRVTGDRLDIRMTMRSNDDVFCVMSEKVEFGSAGK